MGTDRVRYLHHQNNDRVKCESEMIGRFDKSHGAGIQIPLPFKKPPLVKTVRTKNQKPAVEVVGRPPVNATECLWVEMMQRTWNKGDDVKRGEYTLSLQRKKEMHDSYRTMEPHLQEAPREIKVRPHNTHATTYDYTK